jgi:hypothetical protein
MNKIALKVFTVGIAVIMLAGFSLAQDLSTGGAISAKNITPLQEVPVLNIDAGADISILWVETKGVYINYSIDGNFSQVRDLITSYPVNFDTVYNGELTSSLLQEYDVVIICLGANYSAAFSAAEAAAVASYVSNGGGLYLWGDNSSTPNANINSIAANFGMNFGGASADDYWITMIGPAANVSALAPGTVDGSILWMVDSEAASVGQAAFYGRGRVLGIGDFNIYAQNFGEADNTYLLVEALKWLLRL